MTTSTTSTGTEHRELTLDEYATYLDGEVRASVGIGAEEFRTKLRDGTVDWDDPESFYVAGVLGLVNGAVG